MGHHSHNFVDLTGRRFGRLRVVDLHPVREKREARWVCRCSCGKTHIVRGSRLTTGHTKSCGCLIVDQAVINGRKYLGRHRGSYTRLYVTWKNMLKRCTNPNASGFKAYGGRGIRVCKQWQRFDPFQRWALTHGYQDDLTIDRINNDGNYTPSNCQWLTLGQNIAKKMRDRLRKN